MFLSDLGGGATHGGRDQPFYFPKIAQKYLELHCCNVILSDPDGGADLGRWDLNCSAIATQVVVLGLFIKELIQTIFPH